MKNIVSIIVFLLLSFSCQKKEPIEVSEQKKSPTKKDTLELLFSNCIDDGRFHNQVSRISYSDSIFFISRAQGESELYLKGKLILKKNILNYDEFDSITNKFHLKEMDILKFSQPIKNHQFESNYLCTELIFFKNKTLFYSVMKSKSGVIFQYLVPENIIPKLKICNSKKKYIFQIKNKDFENLDNDEEFSNSFIKLIDITGDGKEELFIFYDDASWICCNFDVYQINYID